MKDAHGLETALRNAITGEVRFSDGDRAMYAYDASVYRQVPIGIVIPRSTGDVEQAVAICRENGVPILAARLRHEPGGPVLQRRRRHRHVEISEQNSGHRSGRDDGSRSAGRHLRSVARRGGRARTDHVRSRSGNARSLHDRRDDRKQLVRHARADGGAHRRKRLRTRRSHVRRPAHARGGDERTRTARDRCGRRQARRNLFTLARVARCLRPVDSPPFSENSASGLRLQSRYASAGERLQRGASALWEAKERARSRSRRSCASCRQPQHKSLVVLGFPDLGSSGDIVPLLHEYQPMAIEFFSSHVISNLDKKSLNFGGRYVLPQGREFVVAQFGAQTKKEADAQAEALRARLARCEWTELQTFGESARRRSGLGDSAAQRQYRAYADRPGRRRGMAELGRRRPSAGSSRRLSCATSKNCSENSSTTGRFTGIGDRAASIAASISNSEPRTTSKNSARSWNRRPIWSYRTAAFHPASTETAKDGRSFCPRRSAKRSSPRSESSKQSGIRRTR